MYVTARKYPQLSLRYSSETRYLMHLGKVGQVKKIFESRDPIVSTLLFVGIRQ